MLGQRYYLYLFYINALVNLTAYVPQILYKNRFNGSLTSLALSTLAGTILIILFQSQIKNFPKQNIAEIMSRHFPSWFKMSFLFFSFTLCTFSGILFLLSIMNIIGEFLTLNSTILFYSFLLLIVFSIMIQTNSILFMLEITVLFAIPSFLLILLRFSTDNLVLTDSISQSLTYLFHFPKLNSVVSGLFVFTGLTNVLVYSEHIRPLSRKPLIIICGIICFVLFSSYFIPIGYFGLNGVGKENYVWITAIDSMRIDYFFLERIVIVFILILIGLALMYTILSYHSSLKFLQLLTEGFGGDLKWVGIFIVVISALITQFYIDEIDLLTLFICFFISRVFLDLILLFILLWASRKQMQK